MTPKETELTTATELLHPSRETNPEDEVNSVEQDRAQAIAQLSQNVAELLAVSQEHGERVLKLENGSFLHFSQEGSTLFWFYVASQASYSGGWSDKAVTCAHIVEYQAFEDSDTGESQVSISRWVVDPGGENHSKMVNQSRTKKEFNLAEASLLELADIISEFNEVARHI